jgi:hypothetical protein
VKFKEVAEAEMERQVFPHSGLLLELVHADNKEKYMVFFLCIYIYRFQTDTEEVKEVPILTFNKLRFVCKMDYEQKVFSIICSTDILISEGKFF